MKKAYLVDTDVLIDFLRGHSKSVDFIKENYASLYITTITIAELYSGVREGKERSILDDFIQAFQVVPIDNEIAQMGGLFRRDYGKSHGVGIADAINAAAAENVGAVLVTLNLKHYPMLKNAHAPY